MPVIETQPWLYAFVEACNKKPLRQSYFYQCEKLCHPIEEEFPRITPEELHYFLLQHGLFEPGEWNNIAATVRKMEQVDVWKIVEDEYQKLKEKWNGPASPIYIFPIKDAYLPARKRRIQKNGLSFKEGLFLFLAPDTPPMEVKALLAHEYNHICRLSIVNSDEKDMSLKDSLLIEGLGEYAVKELYGEKLLASWTKLYRDEKVKGIWKREFVPSLNLMGQKNHQVYLYGKGHGRLPKWIGYHFGFQIVDSYQERHGPLSMRELLTKSADELIAGSKFTTN